jgi:Outer membrane protein beta-barrel domain
MQKVLSITSVLLIMAHFANAQSFYASRRDRNLTVVGGIGTSSYYGELTNPRDYLHAKPALTGGLQYYLNNRFSVRAEANWFQIKGDDSKSSLESGRRARNLSFKSDNFEVNLTGHVNFFSRGTRFYQRAFINIYGFGGLGLLFFNPKTEFNGEIIALQPLQTELVDYNRFAFSIPFGFGLKLKAGPFINLAFEGGYRTTFTDYLDDVSTVHPSLSTFTNPIAAALSDRGPEVGVTPARPGSIRGNPKTNDGYFLFSAKLEYYLPTNFIFHSGGSHKKSMYRNKRKSSFKTNKRGGLKMKKNKAKQRKRK